MEADRRAPACRVVLMGMMGSGKSTVGRLLAERTGWPYHDNDDLLDQLSGRTPAEILEEQGEPGLRRAESDALQLGLTFPGPCLLGAAAGTILQADNRRRLEHAVVVWLRGSPETLAHRARGAAHRPWLDEDGEEWMRARLAERAPLYAEVADFTVEVDEQTPDQLAEAIVARLAGRPECSDLL